MASSGERRGALAAQALLAAAGGAVARGSARSRKAVAELRATEGAAYHRMYTDGITDAQGAGGRFGQDRLEEVLRGAIGKDPDEVAELLDGSLLAFEDGPQRDDVAVLILRATAAEAAPETTVVAGSSPVRT